MIGPNEPILLPKVSMQIDYEAEMVLIIGKNLKNERLRTICGALKAAGVQDEFYQLDVSIARGLDYYTGVVFETVLGDLPSIGSVCSGGRYDNLAELYTKKQC